MNVSGISMAGSFHDPFGRTDRAGAASRAEGASGQAAAGQRLTPEEADQVRKLKERDREVRAHEAAHLAAGGGLASGASFTYQRGPDGVNYAVGGEVKISMSSGRTPEETIERARQIRAAALAPADPSGQDRAVASAASAMEREARTELARTKAEEARAGGGAGGSPAVANAYRIDAKAVGRRLDIFA